MWYRCARLWKLRSLDLFGPSLRDIKSYFRLKWVKLKEKVQELGHEMWCFFCVFFYIISVLWKLNLWKWGSSRRLQCLHLNRVCDRIVAFNITFNNILVISWRSVLLVEGIRVPWENHQPVASHWWTLSHIVVSSLSGIRSHNVSGNRHWLHR